APSASCPNGKAFCPSGSGSPICGTQSTQNPANWYFAYQNAAREAHVLFSVHSASDMITAIAKSRASYGSPGFIYIHDEDCDHFKGALYDRLPSYFEQVVAILEEENLQMMFVRTPGSGPQVPIAVSY